MAGIALIKGTVKNYDWGGYNLIPSLLNLENPGEKPFAEYWMGTHPLGDSWIQMADGGQQQLAAVAGQLPFLLKILDVKDMLSIQVHPSKATAEKEFARENAEGIPLDSPQRNYKDANHKPELMVALGDFWLLHGFKPTEELVYTLLNVVELRELLPVFNSTGYTGLYRHVMEMPQEEVNRILQPLIDNINSNDDGDADRYDEDYWAAKAANTFSASGNIDRGVFSIYLFNLVHLKKGEGIFQDAGVPHAYLEGQNVEIMANSDNVLRGGLTTKHIDVNELLKHVKCEPTFPRILQGKAIGHNEKVYETPVPDFRLTSFELAAGEKGAFTPIACDTLILTEGEAILSDGQSELVLKPGQPSAIALAGHEISIMAETKATVFRASLNVNTGE